MRTVRLFLPLLLLSLIAADTPQEAPFTHPTAIKTWNRYQYRANKAREAFEREMANVRAEYVAGLQQAAEAVAKTGDAEELARIAEAQKAADEQAAHAANDATVPIPDLLQSLWVRSTLDVNGPPERVVYKFTNDGSVVVIDGKSRFSKWSRHGNSIVFNEQPDMRFRPITVQALYGAIDGNRYLIVPSR